MAITIKVPKWLYRFLQAHPKRRVERDFVVELHRTYLECCGAARAGHPEIALALLDDFAQNQAIDLIAQHVAMREAARAKWLN